MWWLISTDVLSIISTILQIIQENATAIISVVSLASGSILTYIFTELSNNKEREWKRREPFIFSKKEAHRELHSLCCQFNTIINYKRDNINRQSLRCFVSRQVYVDWVNSFLKFEQENSLYFTSEVLRLLHYFDEYRNDLHNILTEQIDTIDDIEKQTLTYKYIGEYLSGDFFRFSTDIQSATRKYILSDDYINIVEKDEAFTWPTKEESSQYLSECFLYKNQKGLMEFLKTVP